MKKLLFATALLLALWGCSREDDAPEWAMENGPKVTFYATTETVPVPDTKVYADGQLRLRWNADDRITIFNKNTRNKQFRFTGNDGDNGGEFEGVSDTFGTGNAVPHVYAVYPYSSSTGISDVDNTITVTLPAEQNYKEGSFGIGANTMVAVTDDDFLAFKNLCGYLRFRFYGDNITVSSIKLEGNNGEKIAGKAVVTANVSVAPSVAMDDESATTSITLNCPEPVVIGTSSTDFTEFIFAIPPTTFSKGIKVTVTDAVKGVFEKTISTQFSINRSKLKSVPAIEVIPVPMIEVDAAGDFAAFSVSDEASYAVIPETAQSWIIDAGYEPETRVLLVTVEPNNGSVRVAKIVISNEDGSVITPYYIKQYASVTESILNHERNALIAIYNALDGDNWKNKTNWCSDKPVGEWHGIRTNNDGQVDCIDLRSNNLNGSIPNAIGRFNRIRTIRLNDDGIKGEIPDSLYYLRSLYHLTIGSSNISGAISNKVNQLNQLEDLGLSGPFYSFPSSVSGLVNLTEISFAQGMFSSFEFVGGLSKLRRLSIYGNREVFSFPSSIGELNNLLTLVISCNPKMIGKIPSTIGNLTRLQLLNLTFNESLSCEIPKEIGYLTQLTHLNIYRTPFLGNLPRELGFLNNLQSFELGYNHFSGKLHQQVASLPICKYMWPRFYDHTGLDPSGCTFMAPEFNVTDLNGNNIKSGDLFSENKLTVLYDWAWNFVNPTSENMLKTIFDKYNNQNVYILGYSSSSSTNNEETTRSYILDNEIPWPNVFNNPLDNTQINPIIENNLFPFICIFDQNQEVVFISHNGGELLKVKDFIDDYMSNDEYYISSDYASDGSTTTLQQSTTGEGIDLVFMGDAFSDRQIADGTYANVMQKAADAFFSEEPYKSFKDRFNVYTVNVVSATEGYEHYGQALFTGHGNGSSVYGNNPKVIEYAKKAISEDKMDDALVIVVMNEDAYAGTCFMYNGPSGDYGRGLSIAYFPTSSDTDIFNGLVSHEAGGHGFAKLADEYAYDYMGAIPADVIADRNTMVPYGWWKNVDFTSDPATVKWSQFISDSRYASESIGCYEGGLTYWSGVWRPTEASIMRYNTGGFNAPSRYAIWYRIGKLANGESWNGTYEDFVAYDAINRTQASEARRRAQKRNYVQKPLPQLPPPVVVRHSWREELKTEKSAKK